MEQSTKSCGCIQSEGARGIAERMNYAKTGRYALPKILKTKSLDKLDPRHRDRCGDKIGKLTVVSIDKVVEYKVRPSREGKVYNKRIVFYECRCDCGKTVIRSSSAFYNKKVKIMSCGCTRARHVKCPGGTDGGQTEGAAS